MTDTTALEQRVLELERQARHMRLSKVSLLRLQAGDILVVRVRRPLASSENEALRNGFRDTFRAIGRDDVQAIIISDHAEVDLDVVRPD